LWRDRGSRPESTGVKEMTEQAGTAQAIAPRNRLVDKADKWFFLAAFFLGAASIVILKRLEVRQLYVTAVPLLVMSVYAAYVMLSPRYRLRDDRAGDSLYYLGFLFTMVSLAYSLWEFGSSEGGPRSIVTNFGIALATTVLGLSLRVVYHQFRQDPFDVERELRLELTEASDKLRGEIHESIIGFAALRLGIAQSLTEATNAATTSFSTAVKDSTEKYKTALDDAATTASGSASKFSSSVVSFAGRIDNAATQIANSSNALVKAIGAMGTSLSDQDTKIREQTKSLADVLSAMDKSAQSAAAFSKEIAQFQKDTVAQHDAIKTALGNLKRSVESLTVTVSDVVTVESKKLQEHRRILERLQNEANAALNALQGYRENLGSNVEASHEMLSQVQKALVSLTRTIVDQIGGRRS